MLTNLTAKTILKSHVTEDRIPTVVNNGGTEDSSPSLANNTATEDSSSSLANNFATQKVTLVLPSIMLLRTAIQAGKFSSWL